MEKFEGRGRVKEVIKSEILAKYGPIGEGRENGILSNAGETGCDECSENGNVTNGHFACNAPAPSDLREAERSGVVERIFFDDRWLYRLKEERS